ncbi:MAG: ATP synthase F1 subunit delta [Rhodothermales bacterium]|nr:ATP synthase F1 subunit delta [Rhodothermales bacterium]MBO6778331.1 ATP synthase F1 subunit delta [Rhodothermales bacterium]
MSDLAISRRYAQALLEEARAAGNVESTDEDTAVISDSLAGSRDLQQFFDSPVISRDKKKSVVDGLFKDRVGALSLRLLHMLVDKRREGQVADVLAAYRGLRDEELGIVQVSVRSARALDEADRSAVAASLEKRLNKRVRLEVSVDPSLIGGIVVQVGDTVYDGSVSNRLASLRERMMEGALMN